MLWASAVRCDIKPPVTHSSPLFSTAEVKLSELVILLAVRRSPACTGNLSNVPLKNFHYRQWGDEVTTTRAEILEIGDFYYFGAIYLQFFFTRGQRSIVMQWNDNFQVKCRLLGILPLKKCFCWCIFLMYLSLLLSCRWAGGQRGTTGAGVSPMDVRNLSFIRQWRQAGPKYGRVNTNHRSSRDTDTYRQTAINTTHIHKICLCRHMLSCVHARDRGHSTNVPLSVCCR